ncbi:MAG TPA: hypothetical protein VKR52_11540 [Terracidiphilus sp.]|nr:hypothetical protein [Terracidiphilus sp.]
MADLRAVEDRTQIRAAGGFLGPLARAQYAAMVRMRCRMFVIGLRTIRGILELGANGIQLMVFSVIGIGLGLGLGFTSYSLAHHGAWQYLPIEFWVVLFVWQMIPITMASFQDQFDMSGLLRFPLSFGSFYVLYLIFGLLDVSTIMGAMCCLGILIGIVTAHHELLPWTLLALLEFAAFNILLARAILAWVDRWLSQRRTREIVSALFLLFFVSLQLLNPAVREDRSRDFMNREKRAELRHKREVALSPALDKVKAAQVWLPPGITAGVLQHASENKPVVAVGVLAGLGLYALGIGGVLGIRLRAEFRGENLGEAPNQTKQETREQRWLLDGGGPIAATIEKELRTLFRSMPQIYALGVPVLMVFVVGSLFRNGPSLGRPPFQYALPVCVAYGLLGFTRIIYNNLGTEGTGIQLIFMSPTPIRAVILAKNLFHGSLYLLMALFSGIMACLRVGVPSPTLLAITVAWLIFALPANLAVGDIMSLTMAYRVNPGRVTRQPGSQGNALLSMLIQTLLLGVGGAVVAMCTFADKMWLAAPILVACGGIAILLWTRVLANVDAMANDRRDTLIETLAKIG